MILVTAALLGGCALATPGAGTPGAGTPAATGTGAAITAEPTPTDTLAPASTAEPAATGVSTKENDMQELAIADLAKRLGVAKDAITVQNVEEVQWPDASLGCPEPGKMYAQVLTLGLRIVLEAKGKSYEYHTGRGHMVSCG